MDSCDRKKYRYPCVSAATRRGLPIRRWGWRERTSPNQQCEARAGLQSARCFQPADRPGEVRCANMEAVAGRQEEVGADRRSAAGAILATSLAVVGINVACSALGPLGTFPQDVLFLLDCVWRLVQGQSWGIDFHNPMGFGVFEVASV